MINLYNSFDVIPDLFATLFLVAATSGYHNVFLSFFVAVDSSHFLAPCRCKRAEAFFKFTRATHPAALCALSRPRAPHVSLCPPSRPSCLLFRTGHSLSLLVAATATLSTLVSTTGHVRANAATPFSLPSCSAAIQPHYSTFN
ncbi:hypothetical protein A0H81_09009 [Grifola frondosa]|uniref:Uncharacterized protein n=1 Tax=Grifola frondosa TaxID=5627 RepID=A0A1C7M2H9_GRIFR|nr:hypothetical protein A0H81_09009 [Grifola frondosa]